MLWRKIVVLLVLVDGIPCLTTIIAKKTTVLIAKPTTITKTSSKTTSKSSTSTSSTPSTNIGPLTTVFTPPPYCFSITALYTQTLLLSGILPNLSPKPPNLSAKSCFPSYTALTRFATQALPIPYFSPGLCPSGYSAASASVSKGETRRACCPVGYAGGGDSCRSEVTGAVGVGAAVTVGVEGVRGGQFVIPEGEVVEAEVVRVRYKAKDFPGVDFGGKKKLGGGALAGVVVGSVFGGVAVLLGGVLVGRWWVGKRKNQDKDGDGGEDEEGGERGLEYVGGKEEMGLKDEKDKSKRDSEERSEAGRKVSTARSSGDGVVAGRESSSSRSSMAGPFTASGVPQITVGAMDRDSRRDSN